MTRCWFGTLLCAVALVSTDSRAACEPADVAVQTHVDHGTYAVSADFVTPVSRDVVWSVLSDYGRLPTFVQGLRSSVIQRRTGGTLTVEQDAVGRYLFFSREVHLRLEITEQPRHSIVFRDSQATDFDAYAGSWRLSSTPGGCRVEYQLRARPKRSMPGFVGLKAFRDGASILIKQVQVEMCRRAAGGSGR
jgi:hypothetical protein